MNGRRNVHKLSSLTKVLDVKRTVKAFKLRLTAEIQVNERQNFLRLNMKTVLDAHKLVESQIKQYNGQL